MRHVLLRTVLYALDECTLCCKIMRFRSDLDVAQKIFHMSAEQKLQHCDITLELHNFATQSALVQSMRILHVHGAHRQYVKHCRAIWSGQNYCTRQDKTFYRMSRLLIIVSVFWWSHRGHYKWYALYLLQFPNYKKVWQEIRATEQFTDTHFRLHLRQDTGQEHILSVFLSLSFHRRAHRGLASPSTFFSGRKSGGNCIKIGLRNICQ